MSVMTASKIALLLFLAAILQVSAFSSISVGGGGPDVLLVVLIAVSLLRGRSSEPSPGSSPGSSST